MPMPVTLSPYQQFKQKWINCTGCNLCETRRNVVLCRGSIPCDILIIAEAPGVSEDRLGVPMIGPAGKLLDRIISEAIPEGVTVAWTNIICCIPKDEYSSNKLAEPPEYAIKACQQRLIEFCRLCQPKAIIMVGEHAKKWVPSQNDLLGENSYVEGMPHGLIRYEHIVHPAAILRADITRRELMARRCIVTLEEVARAIK